MPSLSKLIYIQLEEKCLLFFGLIIEVVLITGVPYRQGYTVLHPLYWQAERARPGPATGDGRTAEQKPPAAKPDAYRTQAEGIVGCKAFPNLKYSNKLHLFSAFFDLKYNSNL